MAIVREKFVLNTGIRGGFLRVVTCAVDLDNLVVVEGSQNQRKHSADAISTPCIIVQES